MVGGTTLLFFESAKVNLLGLSWSFHHVVKVVLARVYFFGVVCDGLAELGGEIILFLLGRLDHLDRLLHLVRLLKILIGLVLLYWLMILLIRLLIILENLAHSRLLWL